MPLDDYELRDLVERRLCEVADHLDRLAGVPDDELVGDRSGPYALTWRHLWACVEAAVWRLAEHQDPGRWSLTPDGFWPAIARRGPGEVHGWGTAWFLNADTSSMLTPFRA